MNISRLLMKIALRSCSSMTPSQKSVSATNSFIYWGGVLLKDWRSVVISFSVPAIFSFVAFVRSKYLTTCVYVTTVVVFRVEVTLVLALCFDVRRACSAEEAHFFMKKCKSHIAAPSYILLVSYANLRLLENAIIKILSKGSEVCRFICAVISFDI